MKPTKENYQAAREIIDALIRRNCTIEESKEILEFVQTTINKTSIVQFDAFPY